MSHSKLTVILLEVLDPQVVPQELLWSVQSCFSHFGEVAVSHFGEVAVGADVGPIWGIVYMWE